MKQSLGLVEIQGLASAVAVADAMMKSANVHIIEIENTKGSGYMTIKVVGDVGAVNAAVSAGQQVGTMNKSLVSWRVIPRPSDFVESTFCNIEPLKSSSTQRKENKVEKNQDSSVDNKASIAIESKKLSEQVEEKVEPEVKKAVEEVKVEESVVNIKKTREDKNQVEIVESDEKKPAIGSVSKKTVENKGAAGKKSTSKNKNK